MRYPALRAGAAARVEPLEARQLLSLVPAAPAPISPTAGPTTYHVDDDRQQDRNRGVHVDRRSRLGGATGQHHHRVPRLLSRGRDRR